MASTQGITTEQLLLDSVNLKENRRETTRENNYPLCGIGPFRPDWLQPFGRIGVFTAAISVSGLLTSILSIYIVTQVTAIEKHFGFSSSQIGFILSCNDIGFLLSNLLVSYMARRVHIPRSLWVSSALFGVGGLICSSSYFITSGIARSRAEGMETRMNNITQTFPVSASSLCMQDERLFNNAPNCSKEDGPFVVGMPNQYSIFGMVLIAVGMLIQGVGKSPRFSFTVTYLDDNGKKTNTAMYIGILFSLVAIATPVGFAIGAVFSRTYVTLEDVTISPRNPAWIGAWWLGFVVVGSIATVVSLPLLCFPRHMKQKEDGQETVNRTSGTTRLSLRRHLNAFGKSLRRLLTNRIYMMLVISHSLRIFILIGFLSFGPKYLETQFSLTAWRANMLMGVVAVVPATLGPLVSGLVVTKRRLSPMKCIHLMIGMSIACVLLLVANYFTGCSDIELVGRNVDAKISKMRNETVTCREDCHCDLTAYFPVCGSDKQNYFSPCEAGCMIESKQTYTDCRCIGDNATALPGLCETNCRMLLPFVLLSVATSMAEIFNLVPGIIVMIRSIDDKDKPMGLGLSTIFNTLSWIAAPVLLGRAIDSTCIVWTTSCDSKGACALYSNDSFRLVRTAFATVPGVIILILVTLVFLEARKKTDWVGNETEGTTRPIELEAMEEEPSKQVDLLLGGTNRDVEVDHVIGVADKQPAP